jgi:hypothetical protein
MRSALNQNRRTLLYGVYLAAVTALLYALFNGWGYDDPFITYRYARNLASGLGPVYNPGERVLSTTTPLFALLLAPLAALDLDLPSLANLIGAASLAAGGLCLWELGRAWGSPAAGWAGLLLYPTFPLLATTSGSETPLYLALCLGSFALYAHRRFTLAAACCALAVLARPDGVLVAALLSAHYLIKTLKVSETFRVYFHQAIQSLPWRAVLVFLVLLLPWFLFAWSYYGSPVPVTLSAKQQQGGMAISQRFAGGFLDLVAGYAGRWVWRFEAALALLGVGYAVLKGRPWLLLLAWTAVYFAAYSLLGVSRYFWYYAPLVPGFIAAVGLGVQAVFTTAGRLTKRPALARTLAGILLISLAAAQIPRLISTAGFNDRRLAAYREVGKWLDENIPPQASVGALEVGIIGYYARRPMVDFAGLIQPAVSRRLSREATYEDAALWALEKYRPGYLVLHRGLFARLEEYARQSCQLVQTIPGLRYNYTVDLQIYTCDWPEKTRDHR